MYQEIIDGKDLVVKETSQYRWFEYGGPSVQTIMNKADVVQVITPVCQSLLLFLLFVEKPQKVLSLGLGGASCERALSKVESLSITSVEASQSIIDMSRSYFYIPDNVDVICQNAELYLQETTEKFDVILCDLFIDDENPQFMFTTAFYSQLDIITTNNAVVMLNIKVKTEQPLIFIILAIKKQFPYIGLIEFDDYSNIVLMCCTHELPIKEMLKKKLDNFTTISFNSLHKAIEQMRYIP